MRAQGIMRYAQVKGYVISTARLVSVIMAGLALIALGRPVQTAVATMAHATKAKGSAHVTLVGTIRTRPIQPLLARRKSVRTRSSAKANASVQMMIAAMMGVHAPQERSAVVIIVATPVNQVDQVSIAPQAAPIAAT